MKKFKQHITQKQLDEISKDKQLDFLLGVKSMDGQWAEKGATDAGFKLGMCLPTIGQMIEFIGPKWFQYVDEFNFENLCDDLWEGVKEELNLEKI